MSHIRIFPVSDTREAHSLARLHENTLPYSTPLVAGLKYLRRYYTFLIDSHKELVFVARDRNSAAVAAAIVSLSPRTLSRRVLLATAASFVTGIVSSLVIGPQWRRKRILQMLPAMFTERASPLSSPELLYLYVATHARSKGLGKYLTQEVKSHLRAKGYETLHVSTVDAQRNTALDYYERNGFTRVGTFRRLGRHFALLTTKSAEPE